MVQLTFKTIDGIAFDVEGTPGESLMAAAMRSGVPGIEASCGGALSCGTCHVYVAEPWRAQLPAPGMIEAEMHECGMYVEPNSRLACQVIVTPELAGMVVTMPVSQR